MSSGIYIKGPGVKSLYLSPTSPNDVMHVVNYGPTCIPPALLSLCSIPRLAME